MRGTTQSPFFLPCAKVISIHVPREGDDVLGGEQHHALHISIHVPREGDDVIFSDHSGVPADISIHVPREGDDPPRSGVWYAC